MLRERISLDGTWRFQFQSGLSDRPEQNVDWRQITVPIVWQAQFDDLRESTGTGWYERQIDVPDAWQGQQVILHVGAAFHVTTVWINEHYIGDYEGGFLPFDFDITPYLDFSNSNTLRMRVVSPSDDRNIYPDYPFSELPHGKQSWYGHLGGIWQSVWVEKRDLLHFTDSHIEANPQTGTITLQASLSKDVQSDAKLQITILDSSGAQQVKVEQELVENTSITLTVPDFELWSPETPHLYQVVLEIRDANGQIVDGISRSFGFRSFEKHDGQFYLNGQPFYLRGALDQDYYPETICTPPSTEFLENQMRQAKAMGLNCLRYHIKLADPRYYEIADKLGIILWVDFPNWEHLSDRTKQRVKTGFVEMLNRDHHHPSICIWSIVNEDWGTDLVGNAEHRTWLREMFQWLKAQDSTRLVVDNSPCEPNFHMESDINDYHFYRAYPDNSDQWDNLMKQLAAGEYRTHSPYGDAIQHGDEPLIVSEFGNWGLPNADNLLNDDGSEPWWFETGDEWNQGAMYPHGIKKRFHRWGLDNVFGTWRHFIEATQWQQFRAMRHEIESMHCYEDIGGYIITEFTDVHWECNGLLDMKRQPKIYFDQMRYINSDTVLLPELGCYSAFSGEQVHLEVGISHRATQPIIDGRLRVTDTNDVEIASIHLPVIEPGVKGLIAEFYITLPETETGIQASYQLHLLDTEQQIIAFREVRITVLGKIEPYTDARLWSPSNQLREWITELGYPVTTQRDSSSVVVVDHLDNKLTEQIQGGARVILFAEDVLAIPTFSDEPQDIESHFPYTRVIPREGTTWEGNWASTFSWLRRDGVFAHLKGKPLLDEAFMNVIPRHVLTGFHPKDFKAHVSAGLTVGWIHKPMAIVARRVYGQGEILLSTFQLTNQTSDPVAQHLINGLFKSFSTHAR